MHEQPVLVDRFQRRIDYLRMSVTDRCDFRCVYCMAEDMQFLPKARILTLEEHLELARAFTELGVTKIRLTGGEPLVRHNILWLVQQMAALPGLNELVMTTNGSRLVEFAEPLSEAGVKRLNISLDSLNPERFRSITRTGELDKVLAGIDAARQAGFQRIKLNAVILKGRNDDEVLPLARFALERGLDISFIEEMPLGNISEHDRFESFCSSDEIRERLSGHYDLLPSTHQSGGPSNYWRVPGYSGKIGFISPHSHNFCAQCNRVRLTVEGRLLLCLGNEHSIDLKQVLRRYPGEPERVSEAIIQAMDLKPERHHFDLAEPVEIVRFMNMTGG